jgi:hypothetical protein
VNGETCERVSVTENLALLIVKKTSQLKSFNQFLFFKNSINQYRVVELPLLALFIPVASFHFDHAG